MVFVYFFFPQTFSQTIRYATAQDTLTIKNAQVGDLLITGGTEMSNGLPAIWVGFDSKWSLGPGKKILIKGGVYEWIGINNNSSGSGK